MTFHSAPNQASCLNLVPTPEINHYNCQKFITDMGSIINDKRTITCYISQVYGNEPTRDKQPYIFSKRVLNEIGILTRGTAETFVSVSVVVEWVFGFMMNVTSRAIFNISPSMTSGQTVFPSTL
jgi:hypothetical protein